MKVALLQIALDPKSRAGNLQRLLEAVDRAAGVAPAPDLLVLPGCVDSGGVVSEVPRGDALVEGVVEGLAHKAREWGVWLAAGVHARDEEQWRPGAVLFDPDGDVVLRCGAPPIHAGAAEEETSVLWHSSIGDFGLLEPSATSRPWEQVAAGPGGALIVVPVGRQKNGRLPRSTAATVEFMRTGSITGTGAHWAVVSPAQKGGARGPSASFVRAPDGTLLACSASDDETIFFAEIPLEPAPAAVLLDGGGEGHAD